MPEEDNSSSQLNSHLWVLDSYHFTHMNWHTLRPLSSHQLYAMLMGTGLNTDRKISAGNVRTISEHFLDNVFVHSIVVEKLS